MIDLLHHKGWLLESRFAQTVGARYIDHFIHGRAVEHMIKKQEVLEIPADGTTPVLADKFGRKVHYDRETRLRYIVNDHKDNVAIIPMIGSLTKRGDLCSYGMRDYSAMIGAVNESELLAGAVVEGETPGGTVDGIEECHEAIDQSEKPIVGFGDLMVASAGMWLFSAMHYIYGNALNGATEFGSIGVLRVHEYWGKFIEEKLGRVEIIRAPQSEDKARINYIEELSEADRDEMIADLKYWADRFIITVAKGRGMSTSQGENGLEIVINGENITTGKMYNQKRAQELGLIDTVGTFSDALNKVSEIAKSNKNEGTPSKQVSILNNHTDMSFKFLSTFGFGKDAASKLSEEEQESLTKAEESISTLQAEKSVLTDQLATANERVGQLITENQNQDKTIKDLEAKLENLPAGNPPKTEETEDHINEAQLTIDSLPHNKKADAMGLGKKEEPKS